MLIVDMYSKSLARLLVTIEQEQGLAHVTSANSHELAERSPRGRRGLPME